jgi:uncharacterized protein YcbK (DUF882 family)
VGLRVPASFARRLLTAAGLPSAGHVAVLATALILVGNHGLESAIANGDTRTLTMHHIHTDEDITITYKRDGRYDEDALKQIDHFLRDWRKEEEIHMDPRLLDVVWEVSREVSGDKTIHIVCGYRSPATNEMLRRRSSGVARFSQHTLGKAMDFYIPGASLEELRYAGLRLQRGGVGYYPTSGSPFIHLDVGPVRHWPRMSHEELARVFPSGRTVHVASDGRPLPGFAQALADIEKRGSSAPSQTSLGAAQAAGIDVSHVVHKKSFFAALFGQGQDEEDETEQAEAAPTPTAVAAAPTSRGNTFKLASVSKPESVRSPAPAAPPAPRASRPVAAPPAVPPAAAAKGEAAVASIEPATPKAAPAPAAPAAPAAAATSTESEFTATTMPWPVREADNDHVPLDMVLAYAAQPQPGQAAPPPAQRAEPTGEAPVRAASAVSAASLPKSATPRDNVTAIAKKSTVRPTAGEPVRRAQTTVVVADAGMRYDDPWLRAMILAPSLSSSMTAMVYGEPDFTELRALMAKPTSSLAMAFNDEPYPGITSDRFRGEAVVFPATMVFAQRTAWLR